MSTRGTTRSADRPGYMKIETKPFFMTSEFLFLPSRSTSSAQARPNTRGLGGCSTRTTL
jgi:hypothetical protein